MSICHRCHDTRAWQGQPCAFTMLCWLLTLCARQRTGPVHVGTCNPHPHVHTRGPLGFAEGLRSQTQGVLHIARVWQDICTPQQPVGYTHVPSTTQTTHTSAIGPVTLSHEWCAFLHVCCQTVEPCDWQHIKLCDIQTTCRWTQRQLSTKLGQGDHHGMSHVHAAHRRDELTTLSTAAVRRSCSSALWLQ
jgi:hypothetical protein